MFGYVVVNKPEMKVKEFDRYREYYCGLCHALRDRHGFKGQLSLSYDSTFAAVLLTALYEPGNIRQKKSCMIHPVGKKIYLSNPYIDYVADMNLVLAYYKCIDDYVDDKNIIKLGYGNIIKGKIKEIKKKYPDKVAAIRDGIKALTNLENEKCYNIDELAGTFGDIMGEILAVSPKDVIEDVVSTDYDSMWVDVLRKLGFCLGKFIYIMDAFDDVEKDIKKHSFNPFIERYKKDLNEHPEGKEKCSDTEYVFLDDWVKKILMMIAADMADAYERLPIVEEVGILRNIIYSGVWTKYFGICERRIKDERSL